MYPDVGVFRTDIGIHRGTPGMLLRRRAKSAQQRRA